jgi:hypothetical protein
MRFFRRDGAVSWAAGIEPLRPDDRPPMIGHAVRSGARGSLQRRGAFRRPRQASRFPCRSQLDEEGIGTLARQWDE